MAGGDSANEKGEAAASRYDDELLSANWNPVIELLEWSCAKSACDAPRAQRETPEDDVEGFLSRVYRSGGS